MGEPDYRVLPTEVRPPRRRWRIFLGLLLACLLVIAGLLAYHYASAGRDLQTALAEADRLDPGWREGELGAQPETPPGPDNAARVALLVKPLLPARWPAWDVTWDPVGPGGELTAAASQRLAFKESLEKVPPPVQLSTAQTEALRKELQRAAAALAE